MDYRELKDALQNDLSKRKLGYQYIDVKYYPDDKLFAITWENEGGHLGKIATIKGKDVTFREFDDMASIQLIMEFAKQSLKDKLNSKQVTSINCYDLNTINRLVEFYEEASKDLFYQQLAEDKFNITNPDIDDVKAFIETNQGMFHLRNNDYEIKKG